MYADLHCDTFYKCFSQNLPLSDKSLHINSGSVKTFCPCIQTFAHYIPESVCDKFDYFQRMLENTFEIIQTSSELLLFTSSEDIQKAETQNKTLAVLSVEGGDFFDKDISFRADFLERNYIKFLSPCYNSGNSLCSGAFSKTDVGFSKKGVDVAFALSERGIVIDLSHLSTKSCRHALDLNLDCIATHSNCKAVLDHPRNLDDYAIAKLVENGSLIGINLYSPFVGKSLAAHIEHILSFGGINSIAFGADFDGCDEFYSDVSSLADMPDLICKVMPDLGQISYKNVKEYLKKK